ncbi:MAG: group II intron reverse transcriptase/maturase, partial [Bacteroidota bacterium]|nr:group II intron reverse transcriptase/maturase [Bacteroidota bacterium]
MTSGSYFPLPVRTVLIPWGSKAAHDHWAFPRPATVPAQGVVKDYLEPALETIFHPGSFGYRPGRSAHDALQQCQENCIQY